MKLLLPLIQVSFFESNGPTYLVIVLFILLSLLSAACMTPVIRFFAKPEKISFFASFCFALAGGLIGIFIHFYASLYLAASQDPKPQALLSKFGLFSVFLFANMLAFPLLAGIICMQHKRIRALEKEGKEKLK